LCGIACVYSQNKSVGELLLKMLKILKHRGPDGSGIVIDGKCRYGKLEKLNPISGNLGLGHNRLAITGKGLQPIPNENRSLWIAHNGEIYNYVTIREVLHSKNHIFRTTTDSEVILHAYEEKMLQSLDGDFAFVIVDFDSERIEAYRDFIGIRPLFFCKDSKGVRIASERKALLSSGNVSRLPPGHKLIIEDGKLIVEKVESVEDLITSPVDIDEENAITTLLQLIRSSLIKRKYPKVGIFFSGGIDSSVIAKIASEVCEETILITVGTKDSIDLKRAIDASRELRIPLETVVIESPEIVIDYAKKTIRAIDETDPLKVSIGIPIYIAAEKARELGIKVVLTGQGADELFGGYAKYLRVSNPLMEMYNDLKNIHLNNLERDDHCIMASSIEMRPPYLDKALVAFAVRLPLKFKIRNGIRKWILRQVGRKLGLPKEIVLGAKKAIQYGSGVHKILLKQAKKHKLSLREFLNRLIKAEN